jgi:hypothetical protein
MVLFAVHKGSELILRAVHPVIEPVHLLFEGIEPGNQLGHHFPDC